MSNSSSLGSDRDDDDGGIETTGSSNTFNSYQRKSFIPIPLNADSTSDSLADYSSSEFAADERTSVRTSPKTLDANYDSTENFIDAVESANPAALGTVSNDTNFPETTTHNDDNNLKISIDDAIEELGMGQFQLLILVAAGLCFAADAMEVLLLSFLAVVLQAQWDLTDEQTASITSAVFIGASGGTLISGYLGDRYGRKPIFWLTAATICFFGFATAFTQNLYSLVFCRFMVGFGVGGVTVPFDTLAEFVPASHRGRNLLLIEYFWTGGTLLVPVVALLTLGQSDNQEGTDNEWRWFVVVLGMPCLLSCFVAFAFVPESPRWLLTKGKHDKALAVLRAAAKMNGKSATEVFPPGTVILQEDEEATTFGDLFRPEWRWTTILLWLCWGGFAITYFGTIIAVTMIFASDPADLENQGLYSFDYTAILISASSEVAGTTVALLTVDRLGRIPTQVLSYIGGGVSMFVLSVMAMDEDSPRTQMILMGFLARMFFMGGSCTTWVSTAEIMPTEIRTTGHSWANACARLAGAASPFVVSEQHPYTYSGAVILVVSLITAMVTSMLPETKGHTMGIRSKELESGLEVVRQQTVSYKTIA
ncbi:hypothetical protein ACA910_021562 [Epithemia clementina (nom. ined.)]